MKNSLPVRAGDRRVTCAADQASKLYLLFVTILPPHAPLRLGPLFDFVLTRNTGISYGLFQTEGALGQWVLLAFKAAAVVVLRSGSPARTTGSPPSRSA